MVERALTVAWVSHFPIAWLADLPEPLRSIPRKHPAPWQRVLLEELAGRPDVKVHVFALTRNIGRCYTFVRDDVTFHCLGVPRGCSPLSIFWWETLLIRQQLKKMLPDLVHGWGVERGAALVASRLNHPYLVTMHGLLPWIAQRVKLNPFERLDLCTERRALRHASLATVESNFGVCWMRTRYPCLEVCQAEHAPAWLFHRLMRQPEVHPLRFLFVGAPGFLKGTDTLLLALDKLLHELDFHLVLVGMAPTRFLAQMRTATSDALWRRIEVRHGLTPEQVAEELSRATMLLFPTRVDNSPNSVKEAVVAGVPVVASEVGGIPDYVLPNRNGLTFPAGSLDGLIKAIRLAAGHPLFSRGQVDSLTLEKTRGYLSPRVMRDRFLAAYQRAVQVRRSGVLPTGGETAALPNHARMG